MINKNKSLKYWNKYAENWDYMSYSKKSNFTRFPSSEIRHAEIIKYLSRYKKNLKILDIGCADGTLLYSLKKIGFKNLTGIDNSESMINVANKRQIKAKNRIKFFKCDAERIPTIEKYDIICAIGLIEYLNNNQKFSKKLNKILKKKGILIIESRNKLFNLFSSNEYTLKDKVKLKDYLNEVDKLENLYSKKITKKNLLLSLKNLVKLNFKNNNTNIKRIEKFPINLPQFTPSHVKKIFEKNKLKNYQIIFYHAHIFPPRYEKYFPKIYNMINYFLQPLGNTKMGPLICSSFLSFFKK